MLLCFGVLNMIAMYILCLHDLKYRIKKVPPHSLHFDNSCNRDFRSDIKSIWAKKYKIFFANYFLGYFSTCLSATFWGKLQNACSCLR